MPVPYRAAATAAIRIAPPSGRKVAQLRTFWGPNIARRSWSVNQEVEKDDGEPARERTVQIGLDAAGLEPPQRAAAADGGVGDRIDGSVDHVLVDARVDGAGEPAQRAGEVHQPVDDAAVAPRHGAGPGQRRPDHDEVVQLVDVVLVVDDGPGADELLLERGGHGALRVLVQQPREEEADRAGAHADRLEQVLHDVRLVDEGRLRGDRG